MSLAKAARAANPLKTAAIVVLALASVGAIAIVAMRHPTPAAQPPNVAVHVTAVIGDVTIDDAPAALTTNVRLASAIHTGASGHACLVVDPRVRVCLDHDTDVAFVDLALGRRRMQIDRGRVVVSLERPSGGGSFTIATRSGSVSSIKPGIFAVDVSPVAVRARVIRGTVALDAGMFVTDHELYDLVTSQRTLTSPLDEQADLALLDFEMGSE